MEYDLGKSRPNTYKTLKHFKQDIRESRNVNCRLDIDKFTCYYESLWNDTKYGKQNWNCNSKDECEDYEIKREEHETILKNLKNGKASGEDDIPSELYKYRSEKFKTRLLKFLNETYVSGTIAAEWNSALPSYKKGDREDPNNHRGINLLN